MEAASRTNLDVPGPVMQRLQAKFIRDLSSTHGIWKVLLIGKYKKGRIPELVFIHYPVQLGLRLANTFSVIRIKYEDDPISTAEICRENMGNDDSSIKSWLTMSPQRAYLVLTSDIPDRKSGFLVMNNLDIKTWMPCYILGTSTQDDCLPIVGIVVTFSSSLSL